jgi:hypothetical protein
MLQWYNHCMFMKRGYNLMHESFNITSPSPDARHTARLFMAGEIRFGPLYYALSVDDYSFGERIFGDVHLWSRSSAFLAVQEWLTIDYSAGPITALVLIDVRLRRTATVARATKRFLVPASFEDSILVYRKENAGHGVVEHFNVDVTEITEWEALA